MSHFPEDEYYNECQSFYNCKHKESQENTSFADQLSEKFKTLLSRMDYLEKAVYRLEKELGIKHLKDVKQRKY